MEFLQTGIEPQFVLFFDCPEEEMEKRLLGRNQVWFLHVAFCIIIVCKLWIMVISSWKVYSICVVSYVVLLTSWSWKTIGSCGWQYRNHSQEVQGFCRIELTCYWFLWETWQGSQGELTSQKWIFQYPRVLFTVCFCSLLLVSVYYFPGITLVHVLVVSELIFSATTNFVLTLTHARLTQQDQLMKCLIQFNLSSKNINL